MSRIYNWKEKINNIELKECIQIIKQGGIVVFPTETVYGIGANALNEQAVKKIFKAKGRAQDNPLIVHVSNIDMLKRISKNINKIELKLIQEFMPGPFTLILEKQNIIPKIVSAGLNTIGIRMPSNKIAYELIDKANTPIAAPSANISGKPSGTQIEDIKEELAEKVNVIIDGGMCEIGLESTVVKVIDNIPTILRPGKITAEEIRAKIGDVAISKNILEKVGKNEKVESPGMKYRHYAPATKCILVCGENENEQIEKVNRLISKNTNVCVIGFKEHKNLIKCNKYITLGNINNLEEISKNIFTSLRKADKTNSEIILIEGVSNKGIGLAIMNRLTRACEYNIY